MQARSLDFLNLFFSLRIVFTHLLANFVPDNTEKCQIQNFVKTLCSDT